MMKTIRQIQLVVQSTHSMPQESTPPRNGYMAKIDPVWDPALNTGQPASAVIPLIIINRPFYRCGGHIEFIRFKEYYGMPRGGSRSVFTPVFWAKREFQCIFLGKKAIIITSKHGTTIFFSHYNLFLGKRKEKLARKARVNTVASISDRAHAPWASHNTP